MATKTAVIFKSKYGSTGKYAQWIAADLQADLFAADKIKVRDLAPYQTIVYGGYLYAGSIAGIKLLTKNMGKLRGKRIVIFVVGVAKESSENKKHFILKNIPKEYWKNVVVFYLRGAFNFKRLGFIDKLMIYTLQKKLEHMDSEKLDEDSREFLEACKEPKDWTDLSAIGPLSSYVKNNQ